ncbi:MAG: SOS response-associated peptidase [Desulfuromonadaceae bacterium]|nr:SOS response-associated peptidase [Desulfuromonadaceae bacterium]
MCGRFTSLLSPELLAVIFEIFPPPKSDLRYNIAPTQTTGVVRSDGERNQLVTMKWGLVPSWAKDPKIGTSLINARSETVAEKPSFRHAIKKNRCIIPATGFFEWLHCGNKKQPFYIHMSDGGLMAFAGIWEHWHSPDNENIIGTFSILTTTSNDLIAPLHERMPVILRKEDYDLWLNKNMQDPTELQYLYRPIPSDQLDMYPVSERMNSPRFTGPECIGRV